MNKEHISITPEDINSQEYWEKLLADDGMPAEIPNLQEEVAQKSNINLSKVISFENEKKTILNIQEGIDQAIITENIFSSEIPLNKFGLAPCQRAKAEANRGINSNNSRLKNN